MLVRDTMMAEELARDISPRFKMLTRKFWPGPLDDHHACSPEVPLAGDREYRASGGPPGAIYSHGRTDRKVESADNRDQRKHFGAPDVPSGIEVFGVMDGSVDLVLDGGACEGIGASTVDITELDWRVIKEGAVTEREIADCLEAAEE